MKAEDRIKNGEFIVPAYRDAKGIIAVKVGDDYLFNWQKYTVNEVCDGDLEGYCWISRET